MTSQQITYKLAVPVHKKILFLLLLMALLMVDFAVFSQGHVTMLENRVGAGGLHTLIIKDDGSLWAWGANSHGQLGDGTSLGKTTPIKVGEDRDWLMVQAGFRYSVSLKMDGTLWAWGANHYGQLGDGTTQDKSTPSQIGVSADWISLSAGDGHVFALKKDGSLWGWGRNDYGQVIPGAANNIITTPVQLGKLNEWRVVMAGECNTLAIKKDGTLWSWGSVITRHASRDSFVFTSSFDKMMQIGQDNDWHTMAAGSYHYLAIKDNGTLWAWGMNWDGRLGDGTTQSKILPVQVGKDNQWLMVDAGYGHSIALKKDGSLWAWGDNAHGQLGVGMISDKYAPVRIGLDYDWMSLHAGYEYNVIAKRNGSLWTCGVNNVGQLGLGTMNNVWNPQPVLRTSAP